MCGICGFIDTTGVVNALELERLASRMADTIIHRGPDAFGSWVDAETGVAFGSRRLSILDLSPEGSQPMVSSSGRYVLGFNGEIYNFQFLRQELERAGVRFRGHSDTEVTVESIDRWGLEPAVRRFNGMFAFALWDRVDRILHLVRDRMGEKPLYYGWAGRVFLYGSELKSLRAHPGFDAGIDRGAVAHYLRHGYVNSPHCIYEGIRKLPPGTMVAIRPDRPGYGQGPFAFWSVEEAAAHGLTHPFDGDLQEALERVDALLRDAVLLRMQADVPLGAFLSGGIDSSLIVAMMQAQSIARVKTFSIGFDDPAYDEAGHAKAVAEYLGTEHTELYVTMEEAQTVIPRLPTMYDEPFADSSQIPTYLLSRMAQRDVKVSLSGDGGDELFCGYDRYGLADTTWRRISRVPLPARRAAAGVAARWPDGLARLIAGLERFLPDQIARPDRRERIAHLAQAVASPGVIPLYAEVMSLWDRPGTVALGVEESSSPLTEPGHALPNAYPLDHMMFLDQVTYLPGDLLVKLDRASMATSLEARVPFLDHRVVELAWSIPVSMKMNRGTGKWLLRRLLHGYVPRELVDRPKKGFAVPIGSWLRGPLRGWAEGLLEGGRLRNEGYLDAEAVRRAWVEHLTGVRDRRHELWAVLMFEAWLESIASDRDESASRLGTGRAFH